MPKRTNPFGECSPLQMKSHIGQKEINSGVCGEENMKQIYDHTRQLLFNGVQKLQSNDLASQPMHDDPSQFNLSLATLPGQLCLNNQGTLTTLSEVNNNSDISHSATKLKYTMTAKCCCCGYEANLRSQCSFCDRITCQYCNRSCQLCADVFCSHCSILNYDAAEERSFCLNCIS